jgi:hypothetical protein
MHFQSINAHRRGRADSQANAIPLNGRHDDTDLFVNHNLFADAPGED